MVEFLGVARIGSGADWIVEFLGAAKIGSGADWMVEFSFEATGTIGLLAVVLRRGVAVAFILAGAITGGAARVEFSLAGVASPGTEAAESEAAGM